MDAQELRKRTKRFAHRCVKFALALPDTPIGKHIRGQLIRCSTSVAANYRAASYAQSKQAFVAKISIVVEEADESMFWIEFAADENLVSAQRVEELLKEADELVSIFVSSRKTARQQ